jgi:hypothetical protein
MQHHHHLYNGLHHLVEQATNEFAGLASKECTHAVFFAKTLNQKQLCYLAENNCDD